MKGNNNIINKLCWFGSWSLLLRRGSFYYRTIELSLFRRQNWRVQCKYPISSIFMKLKKTRLKILQRKCEITPLFVLGHKWSQRKHWRVYIMPPCCAHGFRSQPLGYMQIICKYYSCTVFAVALIDVCATVKYRSDVTWRTFNAVRTVRSVVDKLGWPSNFSSFWRIRDIFFVAGWRLRCETKPFYVTLWRLLMVSQ